MELVSLMLYGETKNWQFIKKEILSNKNLNDHLK
jgi:hypothetical protein